MKTTIYHVTREWDGSDLRTIAQQCDDGDYTLDEVLDYIADKWCEGGLRKAEEYLDTDGREVHCHATLEEALEFAAEFCEGGVILAVDADGLDVATGTEYPHPVIRGSVPAALVRELALEA